jgi:hypothetical protein
METTARTLRRRPGRWTLMSGVSLIAVGVLSFNAYASFSATATYNQDVTSGYMSLVIDDEDAPATIAYDLDATNMAPGDTAQRGMLLTFAGTISAGTPTISITDNSPTIFTDGTANGLTLQIQKCSVAWDETDTGGGIPTYACSGATSAVLAATLVGDLDTPTNLGNLNTSGANHLKWTWSFPAGANNTFNTGVGHTADLDVTIAAPQRAGTNK